MKRYSAVLILSVLFQQTGSLPFPIARGNHPEVTDDTIIRISEAPAHSALHDLLVIAFDNHIPLGITVGDTRDTDICGASLKLQRGTVTVAELIAAIEAAEPRYRAAIENGVLAVIPTTLSDATAQFFNTRLAHFQSASGPHQFLGLALWRSVRSVLSPGEGDNVVHPVALSAETVQGMDVQSETVRAILDMIVDEGNGGTWILNASQIKILSGDTPMPYEVYGYVGEDRSFLSNQVCSH